MKKIFEGLEKGLHDLGKAISGIEIEKKELDLESIGAETRPAVNPRFSRLFVIPGAAAVLTLAIVLGVVGYGVFGSKKIALHTADKTSSMLSGSENAAENTDFIEEQYSTYYENESQFGGASSRNSSRQKTSSTGKDTSSTPSKIIESIYPPANPENAITMLRVKSLNNFCYNNKTKKLVDIASFLPKGETLWMSSYGQPLFGYNLHHSEGFVLESSSANEIVVTTTEQKYYLFDIEKNNIKKLVGVSDFLNISRDLKYHLDWISDTKTLLYDIQNNTAIDILENNPHHARIKRTSDVGFSDTSKYVYYIAWLDSLDVAFDSFIYDIKAKKTYEVSSMNLGGPFSRFVLNDEYVITGRYTIYETKTGKNVTGKLNFPEKDRYVITDNVVDDPFFYRVDLNTMQVTHKWPLFDTNNYWQNNTAALNGTTVTKYWTDKNNRLFTYKAGGSEIEVFDIATMKKLMTLPLKKDDCAYIASLLRNPHLCLYHDEIANEYILIHAET